MSECFDRHDEIGQRRYDSVTSSPASGYDSSPELPIRGLLLRLLLETFAFFLLLGAKLPLVLDARLESSDVLLEQLAILFANDPQRLCRHTHIDT